MNHSVRLLTDEDLDALLDLRTVAFPGVDLEESEYRKLLTKRLPHSTGLFVGEDLACACTVYPTRMYLAGQSVRMGALAGVASAPEFRRRGLVRELLKDALDRLRKTDTGWSLEYPFDPRFYARMGWQSVPSGFQLELPTAFVFEGRAPAGTKRMPLSDFGSLAPIYDAWAARYTFTLTRETDDARESWTRIVSDQWLDDDTFLYRFDDAYLLYSLGREEGRLIATVEDYAYMSPSGRGDLLRFIGSLQGQAETVRIQLPEDDPLSLDARLKHGRARRWPLQARIVDLQLALAPLSSMEPAEFLLEVSDDLCAWNQGRFRIASGPAGTTCERADEGAGSRRSPVAKVPVSALPLLLCGAVSPAAMLAHGQAAGDIEALTALWALSGGRTPFMPLSDAF